MFSNLMAVDEMKNLGFTGADMGIDEDKRGEGGVGVPAVAVTASAAHRSVDVGKGDGKEVSVTRETRETKS